MTELLQDSDTAVPAAQDSEFEVIGLAMWDGATFLRCRQILSNDDFYNPINQAIWLEMCRLNDAGDVITPTTVLPAFMERGGNYTERIASMATFRLGDARGLDFHLAKIESASVARQLQSTLIRAHQLATIDWAKGDLGVGAAVVAEEIVESVRVVQGMRRETRSEQRISDIIMRPMGAEDWVIPNTLARGERIIITAKEGHGKSTLLRQIAGCVAAGMHPFRRQDIPPMTVLCVDAENPERINTVEWGSLYERIQDAGWGMPDPDRLWIEECGSRNLLDGRDAAKLFDQIDRLRPDLIVIGPLYQVFEANPNDEEPARKLSGVLDRARLMCNSAMIVEAHTPHSEHVEILRPYGASLWKRWPEFGYCLQPDGSLSGLQGRALAEAAPLRASEFKQWRGARAMNRDWPYHLTAGGRLPWEEAAPPHLRVQEDRVELDDMPPEPPDLQAELDLGQSG